MLEHGCLRLVRHGALRDLRELVRVAEQDEVPRRVADGDDVGERDLSCLVDDQRVEERLGTGVAQLAGSGFSLTPV